MSDRVVLGLGMSTSATEADCAAAISHVVSGKWLVIALSTADTKKATVRLVADSLGVPVLTWSVEQLCRVAVPNPSERAASETGTPSVAEAAAILGSGGGRLVLEKTVRGAVTVAAACVPD